MALNVSAGALLVTGSTNIVSTLTNMVVGGTLDVQGATVSFGSVENIADGGSNLIVASDDFATDVDGTNSVGTSANTWFDVWATDITVNASDSRLKENIADMEYGLPEIMKCIPFPILDQPGCRNQAGIIGSGSSIHPAEVVETEYSTDEQTGKTIKTPQQNWEYNTSYHPCSDQRNPGSAKSDC